jgi:hydroxyethylthiazole kinase-like uncharacterized protein yjeF
MGSNYRLPNKGKIGFIGVGLDSGGLMVKLFSVKEMITLEKEANESGLTYPEMMENAGRGIANEIVAAYSHLHVKKVFALVGSGNNGGDALVTLMHLSTMNWETCAYIVRSRDSNDPLVKQLTDNNGQVILFEEDINFKKLTKLIHTYTVLIDGIFGTGIKLPLKGDIVKILSFVRDQIEAKENKLHIVAVDCPSGVDCDTGEVAPETIPAEITITMAGMKVGLIRFPAAIVSGEIRFASIGNIENLRAYKENNKFILTQEIIKQYLPDRPMNAHKGTFGTAFIIAGSLNFTGAALLAGLAAYRIGTGLVTMAVPEPLHKALAGHVPESTWILLPHEMGVISVDAAQVVKQNLDKATTMLIGPGFGLEDTTREFLRRLFTIKSDSVKGKIGFVHDEDYRDEGKSINLPVVVDADGLKLLVKIDHWPDILPAETILTPHPGEMAIMTGISIEEIQEERLEIAKRFSSKWGHIIVLKGAYTVIAAPDGQIAVVPVATAALAKAGTGDVLAGLITGLRAQGVQAFPAAFAGAWIHANAGLLAANRLGNTASVLASDILNAVPQVISKLN